MTRDQLVTQAGDIARNHSTVEILAAHRERIGTEGWNDDLHRVYLLAFELAFMRERGYAERYNGETVAVSF